MSFMLKFRSFEWFDCGAVFVHVFLDCDGYHSTRKGKSKQKGGGSFTRLPNNKILFM